MATSNLQPAWYSSVPTIHMATVTFMRDHADDDPKYAECGIKSDAHLSVPSAMYDQEVKCGIVLNKDTPVYLADNKVTKSFQRPRRKSTSVLNLP